jgi:hypothetical protein
LTMTWPMAMETLSFTSSFSTLTRRRLANDG